MSPSTYCFIIRTQGKEPALFASSSVSGSVSNWSIAVARRRLVLSLVGKEPRSASLFQQGVHHWSFTWKCVDWIWAFFCARRRKWSSDFCVFCSCANPQRVCSIDLTKSHRNHLPLMFIGMQHLQVGSFNLSKDYLLLAYDICKTDPLLLQELGALYYNLQE